MPVELIKRSEVIYVHSKKILLSFFLTMCFFFTLPLFAQSNIEFQSQNCTSEKNFLDRCKPLVITGTFYKASSESIVFITHGSQGVDERHHRYAQHLNTNGISALVIDHWKARGVLDVQLDFVRFAKLGANAHNMVIDIQHATHHFRNLGYTKFGYLGESMGGGVGVLLAKKEWQNHFARVSKKAANKLDAIVGLYGNCNERYTYDAFLPIPMLVMIGELDANTPAKTCKDYISEWSNVRGARMEFIELAGQHHDFDAGFKLMRSQNAENPARCISLVDLNKITSLRTGENFPNTPDGWSTWRRSCLMKPNEIPVFYGNTGNSNTGFDQWGKFFDIHLK